MQAEDRGIGLVDSLNHFVHVVCIKVTEFDGLDAKAIFVMRCEEIRIEELIDEDGHFGPIDVVCQFSDVANFSNHIFERLEVYLIVA